jgi:aspartyl-tRNA(Asn)/glutamyl-tRNA(Gln) amidotransferase subunit B
VFGALKARGFAIDAPTNAPEASASILGLIADGTISNSAAKQVFEHVLDTGADPAAAVDALGLKQVSDTGALEAAIAEVMAANADKVAEYRSGKDKLFGFFVGQTMKATGGKANPGVVNALLKAALDG